MKAIVSVDRNWGIGYQGDLLMKIPDDMKFFKQMTVGKVVVMGRGTYESLPGKEPLKDRINIVISSNSQFQDDRVIICRSLDDLLLELKKYPSDDICIIGGESLFKLMMPYLDELYVTKIGAAFPADTFFTDVDQNEDWKIASVGEMKNYNGIDYQVVKYIRKL
ncbi:dihydrofolate reductase [Dehalobacter sp. DCM]|uniref:dihydrofolate reductase n=1 Tax=Dehalobacter sp. DCM TaxID=2907827 RepID=UPI0030815F35|nr:dihydrofolate reductase [Dehalobacter sp. DCM]